jgi:hypothetical protein
VEEGGGSGAGGRKGGGGRSGAGPSLARSFAFVVGAHH